ncbi:MAG: protein-L-isoaspartate O-methyltransferase [Acidilobaceae archaeon]
MSLDYIKKRKELVEALKRLGYIRSSKVERAMLRVPRELFVPSNVREYAYDDRPLPIGYNQTISAPSIVAHMTELLDPQPGDKVLEIGTGSGYQAAVLAEIVAPQGHVWSIEKIPELAEFARKNLEKTGYSDRVTVIVGDGSKGYEPQAPYDKIIVTAAAPRIPEPLINQLKPGGILVAPVGPIPLQFLLVVYKRPDGRIEIVKDLEVVFVPLIGEYGWKDEKEAMAGFWETYL